MSGTKPIKPIIRKLKRKTQARIQSSGWKVAYADFATVLMAFFLLMWLLGMISPFKKSELAKYFKEPKMASAKSHNQAEITKKEPSTQHRAAEDSSEKLKLELNKTIGIRLGDFKDQILVDTFEDGVRIQVMDKQGLLMFSLGNAKLTENARTVLKVIAESIRDLENKIAIEGHTDALSYSSNKYTNWELSTARASAARQEMERNGLSPDSLVKVSGLAAVNPLIKSNPYDPQNRRISILIYTKKMPPGERKEKSGSPDSLDALPK